MMVTGHERAHAQVTGGSLGVNGAHTYFCSVPADMPAGVAYLELAQGPHTGAACPVLVLPPEQWALGAELLHALRAHDAILSCSPALLGAQPVPPCGALRRMPCCLDAGVLMHVLRVYIVDNAADMS